MMFGVIIRSNRSRAAVLTVLTVLKFLSRLMPRTINLQANFTKRGKAAVLTAFGCSKRSRALF